MAAAVILLDATPRRASDGAVVTVSLAGGGALLPYPQGYRAGLTGQPKATASLDFDGEQLGGGGVTQALEVAWAPAADAPLAELAGLFWKDAPITVRVGPEGTATPPIVATGLVLEHSAEDGVLRIALADATVDLKRPLLADRYAGTGGIEGPVEWAGQIKARAWGRCFNVPGRCSDPAANIWTFGDPTRPWLAFDQVRDTGLPAAALPTLAWQGSAAATFAALRTAAAPDGGGVRCPSVASVKWWTKPAGDLRADIRGETAGGYAETAPEIAARIVAARSALGFAAGAVAGAAAARPAPFGWRVDSEAATAAGELSALLAGVSLSWLIVDGVVDFRRWEWTAPVRAARSETVKRRQVYAPVTSRKLGYRRNWAPLARAELAAVVLAAEAAATADWSGVTGEGKPADFADVTGDNTSKDTNAVAGRPAALVISQFDHFNQVTIPAINESIATANTNITVAKGAADSAGTKADQALADIVSQAIRLDQRIDTVAASGGYDDTALTTEVRRVDNTAIGRDQALAESVRLVGSALTTTESDLRSLVTSKETAAVDRENAIARRVEEVASNTGAPGVDSFARSEVTRVEQASTTRDDALGRRVDGVSAAIGPAVNAKADEITTAYAAQDRALAERARNLETATGQLNARVGDTETATTDGRFAAASTVTQLRSDYNGTAATVTEQAGTITGLQQKAAAYVRVTADAGNGIAQLTLWSDQYGGAWELVGNGRIRGDLVVDGTVTTNKIAGNAVTDFIVVPNTNVYYGSGSGTPVSPGGGGGGGGGCVAVESAMPLGGRADEVVEGADLLMLAADGSGAEVGRVSSVSVLEQPCYRVRTASGITLIASVTTPITLRNGSVISIMHACGYDVPVQDEDGFRWEAIVRMDYLGVRPVALIAADDGTYAAGEAAGRYIFTHNKLPVDQP